MTVQPNACMPVPHYHETRDETVYGLQGVITFPVDGEDIQIPAESTFIKRGAFAATPSFPRSVWAF